MSGITQQLNFEKFSGKDTEFKRALQAVREMEDNPYKGCYVPPEMPTENIRVRMQWLKDHPDEQAKIDASAAEWETKLQQKYDTLYDIIMRHNSSLHSMVWAQVMQASRTAE